LEHKKKEKALLTRKEVAERLRLSQGTLAKWASERPNELPYFLIGRRARYDLDELEMFIDAQRADHADEESES